jgi:hypothetical protein
MVSDVICRSIDIRTLLASRCSSLPGIQASDFSDGNVVLSLETPSTTPSLKKSTPQAEPQLLASQSPCPYYERPDFSIDGKPCLGGRPCRINQTCQKYETQPSSLYWKYGFTCSQDMIFVNQTTFAFVKIGECQGLPGVVAFKRQEVRWTRCSIRALKE